MTLVNIPVEIPDGKAVQIRIPTDNGFNVLTVSQEYEPAVPISIRINGVHIQTHAHVCGNDLFVEAYRSGAIDGCIGDWTLEKCIEERVQLDEWIPVANDRNEIAVFDGDEFIAAPLTGTTAA